MAIRLNGLKARFALATTMVVAAALVANAAYLVLAKRSELRRDIEQRGNTFALVTRQPICEGYETYYASGFYKFRELMKEYLKLEPDVEKIQIADINGRILFDSAELDDTAPRREGSVKPRFVTGDHRLDAVKMLDPTRLPAVDSTGAPALEIVAPYIEDWGRHKLSVLYLVHYRSLRPSAWGYAYTTGGVTLLLILGSALAVSALASRIVSSLEMTSPS
jgi:hypothetical protein